MKGIKEEGLGTVPFFCMAGPTPSNPRRRNAVHWGTGRHWGQSPLGSVREAGQRIECQQSQVDHCGRCGLAESGKGLNVGRHFGRVQSGAVVGGEAHSTSFTAWRAGSNREEASPIPGTFIDEKVQERGEYAGGVVFTAGPMGDGLRMGPNRSDENLALVLIAEMVFTIKSRVDNL